MTKTYFSPIGIIVAAGMLLFQAVCTTAEDWPCYRGPNKDGITSEGIDRWPPVEIWRYDDIGQGYSQVTVSEGRVYVAG